MAFGSDSCRHKFKIFQLSFSLILQIVCLCTPGWSIYHQIDVDYYSGVFYRTKCNRDMAGKTQCETKSWYDLFSSNGSNGIYFIYEI